MTIQECISCSEINCTNPQCQEFIKALEDVKLEMHSIEALIDELYPTFALGNKQRSVNE